MFIQISNEYISRMNQYILNNNSSYKFSYIDETI